MFVAFKHQKLFLHFESPFHASWQTSPYDVRSTAHTSWCDASPVPREPWRVRSTPTRPVPWGGGQGKVLGKWKEGQKRRISPGQGSGEGGTLLEVKSLAATLKAEEKVLEERAVGFD